MDQLDIAIHSTTHNARGGLSRLAKTMGVNEQVLRNKACPTTDSHKLTLREALSIMLITQDVGMLEVLAFELGYQLLPVESTGKLDLFSAVLNVASEQGDVHTAIQSALADNTITQGEVSHIITQISEARSALCKLESAVKSHSGSKLDVLRVG